MFQIQINHDAESLLENCDEWDSLARGVPFRETSWLGPWWRTYRDDKQAYVLVATDDAGTIRGLLPLYRDVGQRTLRMMGDGDACSDYVSVLAKPEDAEEVAWAIGLFLATCAADGDDGWDLLDIDGVVEGDAPMAAFARGLKSGGASLHAQSRMHTWYRPAAASWEEHLKKHGKTQRRRMRRMREKIEEGGCMDVLAAETETQVDQFLGEMIEMHQNRWTAVGQPGSFADPRFVEFTHATCKAFLRRGGLYLNVIQHEGRTIGGEMNIIGNNRVLYSYSAGYDVDASDLEPGRLISIDTLLHLYREKLEGIDFMRGDEAYKQRLSTCAKRVLRIRAVAPTWLPRLRHAAWCTRFELKQWVRRQTGRQPICVLDITSPAPAAVNTTE